mmetsp:Transcript_15621/g.39667  ORF Transcript_15621/g.39667 Transcript_15621/m.39667 type:complete len:225 (-) Transcript_15621:951-1625(-)
MCLRQPVVEPQRRLCGCGRRSWCRDDRKRQGFTRFIGSSKLVSKLVLEFRWNASEERAFQDLFALKHRGCKQIFGHTCGLRVVETEARLSVIAQDRTEENFRLLRQVAQIIIDEPQLVRCPEVAATGCSEPASAEELVALSLQNLRLSTAVEFLSIKVSIERVRRIDLTSQVLILVVGPHSEVHDVVSVHCYRIDLTEVVYAAELRANRTCHHVEIEIQVGLLR